MKVIRERKELEDEKVMEKIKEMEHNEGQEESAEISRDINKTLEIDEAPRIKGFKHSYS